MNRINSLFENKKRPVLSIYFTAGFPSLNDTVEIISNLENAGVDMIEIGIPFSDPVADGPVIQRSSQIALKNGMSLEILFRQLKDIRKNIKVPLLLMGYFNTVYRFGVGRFVEKCMETGIDGTILPDLPVNEFMSDYEYIFDQNDLHNIFLVTPQTPDERIKFLDKSSRGFLYVVSSFATTGVRTNFTDSQIEYFRRLSGMSLVSPMLIGFGISGRETFRQAGIYSNGAIIGSAFIKVIEEAGPLRANIHRFIREFRDEDLSQVR